MPSPTASSRFRGLLRSATAWHYASLIAGAIFILVLQSGQWFFFDEWDFLQLDGPGLLDPHVGHWSTSPMLITHALREIVGLGSYLPYALLVTAAHLAAAHLIWRIAARAWVAPWIATLATTAFIVLGSGAENILWAFQIGYVGALALGLWAFLLATHPARTGRFVAIVAITLFALTWSGTAIPLVLATALALWRGSGRLRAVGYVAISAAVYLAWYLAFATGNGPDTGALSFEKLFVQIPQFIGVMLILGFGDVLPIPLLAFLGLVAIAVWLIVLARRRTMPAGLPIAVALAVAAVAFAFMGAYSRAAMSVPSGRASRYVYLLVLLLLPLIGVALTRLVARRPRVLVAVAVGLALTVGYQGARLGIDAARQAAIEQGSRELLSASLAVYLENPGAVDLTRQPDPRWAPDLDLRDLVALHEAEYLPIGDFDTDDRRQAELNILTPTG